MTTAALLPLKTTLLNEKDDEHTDDASNNNVEPVIDANLINLLPLCDTELPHTPPTL